MELDKKKVLPIPIVLFSPPTQITCQLMFNGPCRKFGVFSNFKGVTKTKKHQFLYFLSFYKQKSKIAHTGGARFLNLKLDR